MGYVGADGGQRFAMTHMHTNRRLAAVCTTIVGLALGLCTGARAGEAPISCVGDCNDDGTVSVNELVSGVAMSLGSRPLSGCPAFDANGNQQVTIDELLGGVNNALRGCALDEIAAQVKSNMQTVSDGDDFLREMTDPRDPIFDRMTETAAFLMSQPGVVDAEVFPNGLAILITHDNGLESMLSLIPDFVEEEEIAADFIEPPPSSSVGHSAADDVPTVAALIQGRDLTERLDTVHYPEMEKTLRRMGFGINDPTKGVARLQESDYTTNFFRNDLGTYQIIYIIGHGQNNGKKSVLSAGNLGGPGAPFPAPTGADAEDLDKKRLLTEITSGGFLSGVVQFLGYDTKPKPRYKITSEFIEHYYPGDSKRLARDSLVFLDGCNVLDDLPRALSNGGAAAVVYYAGNTVSTETTQLGTPPIDRLFFAALANGKSVDEAIVDAKQNASQVTLTVYPPEGGKLRFIPVQGVDFSPSCEFPRPGMDVIFTQDKVMPENAQIAKWVWNFGDGKPEEESMFLPASSTNTITHKYESAREDPGMPGFSTPFKVTLTVTDLFGHQVKKEKEIRLLTDPRRNVGSAGGGSCPIPPPTGEIRVKVIMTYSEDPNDNIASRLYNVHLLIGGVDAVIGEDDNVARIVVPPGRHVIKFPKDNGLDDEQGNHLYRVGSINIGPTNGSAPSVRCAPNSQEGDIVWTFDTSVSNPDGQSDYEVAPRIVPFEAPPLENGASCQ
jgi:hypothetical protein